jgi:peptidoglycan hydrolase-like protein with peptidoglycan-binding domain
LSLGHPSKATTAVFSSLLALVLGVLAWLSPITAKASVAPIHGRSTWIWYLSRSDGGSVPAIVSRAHAAGVTTLIVKSSDGGHYWSQFSPGLVRELRAGGVHVCAWQYVYGAEPVAEADMGARAVEAGAQCLIIDAEADYEGRYASAATYLHELRRLVGRHYPVGLASFPYVDYHPAFPYSVFLGPGGAQFDMPQMYWVDIGRGVGTVFRHTYTGNRIYRRPIYPLGQTYGSPPAGEIQLFRGLDVRYGAPGISWWDYAWASADDFWPAISGLYAPAWAPPLGYPALGLGSSGDAVLWMQEHLAREFPIQRTTGLFGPLTLDVLRAFQGRHRLPVTGWTDPATWRALLRLHPVATAWSASANAARANARAGQGAAFAPQSASLPPRRREIAEVGSDRAASGNSHAEP